MKKRLFTLAVLTLCICMLFTGCAEKVKIGLSSEGDGPIKYYIENGEVSVVSVENKTTVTEIVIPDEYNGMPVTKIADFSMANLEYAVKITLGKNVREIGTWAMTNNQHIEEITVSDENESFCAVDGVLFTKDMKTIVMYPINKDVTVTKNGEAETRTSEYTIPDGVEVIGPKAFYKCYPLTKLTIPDSVKRIEEKAFFYGAFTSITLPESLEFIGKDAFGFCSSLNEKLIIPAAIKEIAEYAFYNCTALLDVEIKAKEADLTLGEKWYPTNNGLEIKELKLTWAE